MSFPEHIPSEMSKVGYTEVSLGETLQYEHRIKVNDFVRVLEEKGEIKTCPLKVFPGLELMTIKFGDVEKKVYKAFTNGVIVIHSGKTVRRNHPYNGYQETFPGVFIYNTDGGWQDEAVTLELIFSLHHPGVLLMSQEVSVPKSLDSQETLPAMIKSIMLDSETADLILRCDTKSFRVHKTFLCYRSVLSFFSFYLAVT